MEPSIRAQALPARIREISKHARADCDAKARSIKDLNKTIRIYCSSDIVETHGVAIVSALKNKGYKGTLSFPRTTEKSQKRFEQDPLSFLIRPTAIMPPAMVQRKIGEETWTLISSIDHPVRQSKQFTYADALGHEFVVVRPFEGVPNALDVAAAMRGQKRKICAFVKHYHEMIPFVLSGTCICIIPSTIARSLAQIYPVFCSGVNGLSELPSFTVSLAWHPKFTQDPLSIAVRRTILNILLQSNGMTSDSSD